MGRDAPPDRLRPHRPRRRPGAGRRVDRRAGAAAADRRSGHDRGGLFPLTSALHVRARGGTADRALGEILTVAAFGQMGAPLLAGAIAQAATLRAGLIVMLPLLALLATAGLALHRRGCQIRRR